jgi:hypothetical protein
MLLSVDAPTRVFEVEFTGKAGRDRFASRRGTVATAVVGSREALCPRSWIEPHGPAIELMAQRKKPGIACRTSKIFGASARTLTRQEATRDFSR